MADYKSLKEAQSAVTSLTAELNAAKAAVKSFGGDDSDSGDAAPKKGNVPPQFQSKGAKTTPAPKNAPPSFLFNKKTPAKSTKKSDFAAALASSKGKN